MTYRIKVFFLVYTLCDNQLFLIVHIKQLYLYSIGICRGKPIYIFHHYNTIYMFTIMAFIDFEHGFLKQQNAFIYIVFVGVVKVHPPSSVG